MSKKRSKKGLVKAIVIVAVLLAFSGTVVPLYIFNYDFNLFVWRFIPTRMPEGYTITAHTGCEGTKANSMESVEKGFESGAQIIEVDVNFTADGSCILSHDEPQAGENYTTLEEVFSFLTEHPDMRINLDLKSTSNMDAVYDSIVKYRLEKRAFFTGVGWDRVEILKEKCPGIAFCMGIDIKKDDSAEEVRQKILEVKEAGSFGVNIHYSTVSRKLVEICHENDMIVSVYTVDKPAVISHVLSCAPDNITTRKPVVVQKFIHTRPESR